MRDWWRIRIIRKIEKVNIKNQVMSTKSEKIINSRFSITPLQILLVIFLVRVISVILTELTTLNRFAIRDAVGFAQEATYIANILTQGELSIVLEKYHGNTTEKWSLLLSPFWLLPGPSNLYAALTNAFIASLGIYNVYIIGRYYHSHSAGILMILPMTFFPSWLLLHGTIMRESLILFCITTSARVLIVPSDRSRVYDWSIVAILFYLAIYLRPENLPVFVLALGVGLITYAYISGLLTRAHLLVGFFLSLITAYFISSRLFEMVESVIQTREVRARGRAVYLLDAMPQNFIEIIAFSWIGALFFLYAPFPWMFENETDVLLGFEAILNILLSLIAISGAKLFFRKNPTVTLALVSFLIIGSIAYGLGTSNYGIAARHRHSFLWVIYLFAAMSLIRTVRLKI